MAHCGMMPPSMVRSHNVLSGRLRVVQGVWSIECDGRGRRRSKSDPGKSGYQNAGQFHSVSVLSTMKSLSCARLRSAHVEYFGASNRVLVPHTARHFSYTRSVRRRTFRCFPERPRQHPAGLLFLSTITDRTPNRLVTYLKIPAIFEAICTTIEPIRRKGQPSRRILHAQSLPANQCGHRVKTGFAA